MNIVINLYEIFQYQINKLAQIGAVLWLFLI